MRIIYKGQGFSACPAILHMHVVQGEWHQPRDRRVWSRHVGVFVHNEPLGLLEGITVIVDDPMDATESPGEDRKRPIVRVDEGGIL